VSVKLCCTCGEDDEDGDEFFAVSSQAHIYSFPKTQAILFDRRHRLSHDGIVPRDDDAASFRRALGTSCITHHERK
jgi:hypothetical protein